MRKGNGKTPYAPQRLGRTSAAADWSPPSPATFLKILVDGNDKRLH